MKSIDFLIGLVVLFMGILPLLSRFEQIAEKVAIVGQPVSMVYQGILIEIGAIVIVYSLQKPRQK